MEKSSKNLNKLAFLPVLLFVLCGCSLGIKYLTDRENLVRLPQFLVSIDPYLEDNALVVNGLVQVDNPYKSDIAFDKIFLEIKDEDSNIISSSELDWKASFLKSKQKAESVFNAKLDLSILNKKELHLFLKTNITYKRLAIKIPFNSEVAVVRLSALKKSFSGPMVATVYFALKPDILGNISIDYLIEFENRFAADLMLSGDLKIYFVPDKTLGNSRLDSVLLKANLLTQVKGTVNFEDSLRKIIFDELVKNNAQLKLDFIGELLVAKTQIKVPFKIKLIHSIDFSLFSKVKN